MSARKPGENANLDMAQIMGYLQSYHAMHGYMPSNRDIATFFGVSVVAAQYWLNQLERFGHIQRPLKRANRAIRIVKRIEGHVYELG